MKLFLLGFLVCSGFIVRAQTNLMSQINDDGKTLSILIKGEKNGKPVEQTHSFNVVGMSNAQKDALKNRVLDSLGLGDRLVPPSPSMPNEGQPVITFTCGTCTGKGKLTISGNNFSTTHEFDLAKDAKPTFPFDLPLAPGDYRLMYWQNKVLQIQSSFTVKKRRESRSEGEVREFIENY